MLRSGFHIIITQSYFTAGLNFEPAVYFLPTFTINYESLIYKHLFFDLDRTLWDFDANALESLTIVYQEFELDRFFKDPLDFYTIYTSYNDQLWEDYRKGLIQKSDLRNRRFFMTLADAGERNQELADKIGERYMYLTPRMNRLFPNTRMVLDYLSGKGYKMYILTNGFTSTQARKMNNSGLTSYFVRTFSSEELGVNKPDREMFHWAVTSINAKKTECLMIGDDPAVDIAGASSYGLDSVWFNPRGYSASIKPTYTISNLLELKNIL